MSEEYFKMVLAIYLYNLTGNIPKENLIVNIMQNIRKQAGQTENKFVMSESKQIYNAVPL